MGKSSSTRKKCSCTGGVWPWVEGKEKRLAKRVTSQRKKALFQNLKTAHHKTILLRGTKQRGSKAVARKKIVKTYYFPRRENSAPPVQGNRCRVDWLRNQDSSGFWSGGGGGKAEKKTLKGTLLGKKIFPKRLIEATLHCRSFQKHEAGSTFPERGNLSAGIRARSQEGDLPRGNSRGFKSV